jgi:hypothetical protein
MNKRMNRRNDATNGTKILEEIKGDEACINLQKKKKEERENKNIKRKE